MKRFKGVVGGSDFKGVMKFDDVIEMQDKAVVSIQTTDAFLSIHSGMNTALTASGLTITPGILLWGGFPATFIGKANVFIDIKQYYTILMESIDYREKTVEGVLYSYDAYDEFTAIITTVFHANDEVISGKTVVGCIPFFYTAEDFKTQLVLDDSVVGDEGEIIDYDSGKGIVYICDIHKYVLRMGTVLGDEAKAVQLGGILIEPFVMFGDRETVETALVSLPAMGSIQDIPAEGTLINVLAQVRKNINEIKDVAYTSNYADLDFPLRKVDELLFTLDEVLRAPVLPSVGNMRMLLSHIVKAINDLKLVAYSGLFIDLLNVPVKLSEFSNDLPEIEDPEIGDIKLVPVSRPIPAGWQVADGTNGTVDMSPFTPEGTESLQALSGSDEGFELADDEGEFLLLSSMDVHYIQKVSDGRVNIVIMAVDYSIGTIGTSPLCGASSLVLAKFPGTVFMAYSIVRGHNGWTGWYKDGVLIETSTILNITVGAEQAVYSGFFFKRNNLVLNRDIVGVPEDYMQVASQDDLIWGDSFEGAFALDTTATLLAVEDVSDTANQFDGFYLNGERLPMILDSQIGDLKYWKVELESNEDPEGLFTTDILVLASWSAAPTVEGLVVPEGTATIIIPEGPYRTGDVILIEANVVSPNQFIFFTWKDLNGVSQTSFDNPMSYTVLKGKNTITAALTQYFNIEARTDDGTTERGTVSINGAPPAASMVVVLESGSENTFQAFPATGWRFLQWTSNVRGNIGFENPLEIFNNVEEILTAVFAVIFNELVVEYDEAMGVVTGAGSYEYGEIATLNETPLEGCVFDGWYKDDILLSSDSSFDYTPTEDTVIEARFTYVQVEITATLSDPLGGSVSGAGTVDYGTLMNLNWNSAPFFSFVGWYEGEILISASPTLAFTATYNRDLEARVLQQEFTINLVVEPEGAGEVTGGGLIGGGETANVIATPLEGSVFEGWFEGLVQLTGPEEPEYEFQVISNKTLTAHFSAVQLEILIGSNDLLKGTVTGEGTYNYGEEVTAEATPLEGYHFVRWYERNTLVTVSTDATFIFDATADLDIVAEFVADVFLISVESNNILWGTVEGGGDYDYNVTATVRAIPELIGSFVGWYEGETEVSTDLIYEFVVTEARTLVAVFELTP